MTVTQWMMGAATVTATYVRRGKRFRVFIRPADGPRISRSVRTEADAIALVRHFNRLGMAGVDLTEALRKAQLAKVAEAKSYPTIREALPAFLDEMVGIGEIRKSTAKGYKNRLAVWAYPQIGDTAWNELTREQIGEVLVNLRAAGRSMACLEQIRCPLTRFYQWQRNAKGYKGRTRRPTSSSFSAGSPVSEVASEISNGSARRRPGGCSWPAVRSSPAGLPSCSSRSGADSDGAKPQRSRARTSTGAAAASTCSGPGRRAAGVLSDARTAKIAG